MSELFLHPGVVLILAAIALPFLAGHARSALILIAPALALALTWQLGDGVHWQISWIGLDLQPLVADRLTRLFATIFALMAFGGGLFALGQKSRVEVPAALVYAGSAIGVTFAGDLVTLFVFWELMAVGSTLVLWSAQTESAFRASRRYLAVHLFGGVVLFAGITGHIVATGSTAFAAMQPDSVASALILIGFLINAGAPMVSSWLPDAYPEASWSGTVFLSAFTTKTAVYVLLRGFPGTELLIWLGIFMIFYGIVYALLENDMRRILAYSIVNQVGFMVTGIGIGTEMALNGAAAHAFTHIIYKALLLMSAGSVLLMTGRRKCSELGGLFHTMPIATICGTIGALAISSFPFTSGFVSKSMVTQAAIDGHMLWIWLALAAASAGVFLHAGIKFPWFVFFQKDSGLRPPDPPATMRWAMIFFAFLCIALGVWPDPLYAMLPYAVDYVPYTAAHVLTQLQLLLFSGLAFFVMLKYLKRTPTITLDADWTYRVLFANLALGLRDALRGVFAIAVQLRTNLTREFGAFVARETHHSGLFVPSRSTRGMATWVMTLLLAYLAAYYIV